MNDVSFRTNRNTKLSIKGEVGLRLTNSYCNMPVHKEENFTEGFGRLAYMSQETGNSQQ